MPTEVGAMPGLLGYMLAIVVTLGGYLVGLHWLVTPPDPWQSNPRTSKTSTQQFAAKKRMPLVRPVEAEAAPELTASVPAASAELASAEIPASLPAIPAIEPSRPAQPSRSLEQHIATSARVAAEPFRVAQREPTPPKTRSVPRKRVERAPVRKLELMVLRTYERSDGRRFSRLLPLSSARSALAYQPDDPW